MALVSERFVIPVDEQGGRPKLLAAVKRYTISTSPRSRRGIILLLTHGVTFHKELWEPTLSRLFDLQSQLKSPVLINEAWVIDCPNHGESAALNADVLSMQHLTFRDYARAVTALLASGLVDLTRFVVALGHSAGSAPLAWAIDEWYFRTNSFPFRSLIMLEPPLISTALDSKYGNFNAALATKARQRRGHWPSRKDASQWFQKQQRLWDPRCSELYAEFGLRTNPSLSRGVVLSCPGSQEAACYSVSEQDEALQVLRRLCPLMPVHTIFSEYVDLSPHHEIRENVVDQRQGRRMASVTWMPGVGHFAPFENPDTAARAIFHALFLSSRSQLSHTSHLSFTEARL